MYDFKKTEEEVLKFWQKNKTYEKVVKKNKGGKKFYFMDGPPYATGNIHMGTALNKILKDIAIRSQRFQGKEVFDKAGYDTHGVPIEFQIEKEIGSKSRQDIEKFGVKRFINKCKQYATKHIDLMNSQFENLGVWMDFKDPYLTLKPEYIEAIWNTFKIADKKDLLYLGKYPIHICPRCETAVAYNEIEHIKQKDTSIYIKFPLAKEKNKFLVIWTTTPWTLPGNTAVMVNPNFNYSEIKLSNGEIWILAKEKVQELMSAIGAEYAEKNIRKGKELEGLNYVNPLIENIKLKTKNAYKIILSKRYVNLEEGTGLVHCAPGHGKEDYEVGKKYNIDMPSPVGIDGLLTEEAGKYKGKKARIVDEEIIKDLEDMNMLIYKHQYTHDYPVCWRCKSPLLMISLPQWFFKISKIHKKLLRENKKINWIPRYMKLRMKAWLEGISDWPISRKRYWGTPLPIWICDKCGKKTVIGSIKELEKLSKTKIKNVHKPDIDKIKIKCNCGGKAKRIEEVLDVWFDSGVSSWAALGYPQKKENFKKFWPADLNIEGKDQIRGWWNSQLILSMITFDKKPFDAISVHGMVLDLGKRKMSKSKGNIISPQEIINKYGRDSLRYYFCKTSKGEDFAFNEKEFNEINKFVRVLINVNNFMNQLGQGKKTDKLKTEDKWILSRLNSTIKNVIGNYNSYQFTEVIKTLEEFLINDVSRVYIQIIRERLDENKIKYILNEIMKGILLLLSPIIPFLTEKIWQEIGNKDSIHLQSWPKTNAKAINSKLEQNMEVVLKIIEAGLAERDKIKVGLRWPLAKAEIKTQNKISKELQEIIARQLNIKKIKLIKIKQNKISVKLDKKLTPELEAEGFARELSRKVQALRKKAGLVKTDEIELSIQAEEKLLEIFNKQKQMIKTRTNAKKIMIDKKIKDKYKQISDGKIKGEYFKIGLKKI